MRPAERPSENGSSIFFSGAETQLKERLGGGWSEVGNRTRQQRLSGLGGRLALSDKNILFSTARSVFGGNTPLGGIRSAALATTPLITHITPSAIVFDQADSVSEKAVRVEFRVVPSGYEIGKAQVEIYKDGALLGLPLLADTSGSSGLAIWPGKTIVDRKAVYTARAVVEPGSERVLRSPQKRVPLVEIVFVDKEGEEILAPPTSDPQPVITLDPVLMQQVTRLGNGTQAQVKVSGVVKDGLADIVPEKVADVTQVMAGGQSLAVTRLDEREERPTVTRPYAFKGKFEGTLTVDLLDGPNTVVVEAENAIGNRGYDSFTINVQKSTSLPQTVATGAVYGSNFLDPLTLVAQPMSPTVADSVVLYHGATSPTGGEVAFAETGADSLTFAGVTPELGQTTLTLETALATNDPGARDVVRGTLSSSGLVIMEQPYEFLETEPNSGVFRNAALRLPSNDAMEVMLEQPLSAATTDTLRVKVRSALDQDAVALLETAPDSRIFTSELRVPGLGSIVIVVRGILEATAGAPARMRMLLDSSELGLKAYYLELIEVPLGSRRFRTLSEGAPTLIVTPPSATQTTLVGVEDNEGSSAGSFEPVWVVAKGLTFFQPGDVGKLDGKELELTNAPAPGPARSGEVRFKLPVVAVHNPRGFQASNVARGPEDPRPADRNQIKAKPYTVEMHVPGQGLEVQREASWTVLSKLVAIRGTRLNVMASFVTESREQYEVTKVSAGEGMAFTLKSGPPAEAVRGRGYRVTVPMSVEVKRDATIGPRDLTFTFVNGKSATFKNGFEVSRGRIVVFAVDGLSFQQFRDTQNDGAPNLEPGLGTALREIFGTAAEQAKRAIVKSELTTFPPITFSRWSTIFSGRPPRETLVPGLQWLNRQALIDPAGDYGSEDQCVGCLDNHLGIFATRFGSAANRHFKVDFVYDKLRRAGFRSIVAGPNYAGLGKGTAGNRQGDKWVANDSSFPVKYLFAGSDALPQSILLDESSTKVAEAELDRAGKDFDLMVVYLPGVDHYVHGAGVSGVNDPQGEGQYFIRGQLHARINRIVSRMEKSVRDSTVFAVFADHGHVDTDPEKAMSFLGGGGFFKKEFMPWVLTLRPIQPIAWFHPNEHYCSSCSSTNVIFDPQFGMANVYVAAGIDWYDHDWRKPPSLELLEPIVNSIYSNYMDKPWAMRPVADMLVRVPASPDSFAGSYYMAVPRGYKPDRRKRECGPRGQDPCTLAAQLVGLDALRGLGLEETVQPDSPWTYQRPVERINDWLSPNTGDIALLANMKEGYHFGQALKGNHGSLTAADAKVPVAFGYLGATGGPLDDTTLATIRELLPENLQEPIETMVEALALERFFLAP